MRMTKQYLKDFSFQSHGNSFGSALKWKRIGVLHDNSLLVCHPSHDGRIAGDVAPNDLAKTAIHPL
jgi:hypothetical protein